MKSTRHIQFVRRALQIAVIAVSLSSAFAHASATLFLEEPYGKLGFFTATGHAAVYLSGVCAETPVKLRPCLPRETGVVISRYDGVGRYDWIAIPLIPYLYAVERPKDVPLFADAKLTLFLRDQYRRKYLEAIAPDAKNGETPGGNWYQLVGSSYDRTIYGFEIETTPEQDAALIRKLNSSPNESHFHLASRNCADFSKNILNFYFPKSFHRSIVADLGMTTPKQMAKLMTKNAVRHPELRFSRAVIAQVPGTMPRSTAVHGVVESFLKAKKYIVPSVVVNPIFAGCVAAVYVGTGAGHFEPGRSAKVFVAGGDPEAPLNPEDLRAYREELKHLVAAAYPDKSPQHVERSWGKLQSKSRIAVDDTGSPVLKLRVDERQAEIGLSARTVLQSDAPPDLVRELLEARLQAELSRRASHGISETEVVRDWALLQKSISATNTRASVGGMIRSEELSGSQP
jgi:hypothetical protein